MQWSNKNVIKDVQMSDEQQATSIVTVMPVIPEKPKEETYSLSEEEKQLDKEKQRKILEEEAAKQRLAQEQRERDTRMAAEIEKLTQLKNQILAEASTQASKIRTKAQQECEVLKETTYKEAYESGQKDGYEAGFTQGMDQATEEGQRIIQTAQDQAESLFTFSQQYVLDKKEEWTVNSLEMAQALIQKQFELDETTILSVLEPIWLEIESPDQMLIIRTHPQHAELLEEQMLLRKTQIQNFRYVILKEPDYTLYQVQVESDEKLLTFELEMELQRFLEQLKKDE